MNKKNELVTTENKSPWTQEQVNLITRTVAKGATPDELKLFLYTASRTGLDPLTKQIHFVKRKDQMTIQTGIDGYRAIAERTGTLAGIEDVIYDVEDKPRPNKATVTVWRLINGEKVPFTASARWGEYVMTYYDKEKGQMVTGQMWQKMPYLMLGKCAEALALRKAFPNDLSGLYTNEEMQQADNKVDDLPPPPRPPVKNKDDNEEIVTEEELHELSEAMDGEIVEEYRKPLKKTGDTIKVCDYCGNEHTGKYNKCLDCWKAERNGQKLVKKETKVINNPEAKPF